MVFENGRQTDRQRRQQQQNHRIIGLRNLAKASAAQKLKILLIEKFLVSFEVRKKMKLYCKGLTQWYLGQK